MQPTRAGRPRRQLEGLKGDGGKRATAAGGVWCGGRLAAGSSASLHHNKPSRALFTGSHCAPTVATSSATQTVGHSPPDSCSARQSMSACSAWRTGRPS